MNPHATETGAPVELLTLAQSLRETATDSLLSRENSGVHFLTVKLPDADDERRRLEIRATRDSYEIRLLERPAPHSGRFSHTPHGVIEIHAAHVTVTARIVADLLRGAW